jgi:hypothetical protein
MATCHGVGHSETELVRRFSVATDHNRRIDKRRELLRAFPGLAVVSSALSTLTGTQPPTNLRGSVANERRSDFGRAAGSLAQKPPPMASTSVPTFATEILADR